MLCLAQLLEWSRHYRLDNLVQLIPNVDVASCLSVLTGIDTSPDGLAFCLSLLQKVP